jgi:hypothetical protein
MDAAVGFMKKLLVVYYSQSGQLEQIVRSILAPLSESGQVELTYECLRPEKPYPFPWPAIEFADAFPESLQQIPCRLAPLRTNPDEYFDGVILAYQVWYLSPSIPISSFLQSVQAARLLSGRPVVTLIGCRNMWLLAHEKVKKHLVQNRGVPAGNIVLMDRAPNLLGIVSIAAWMLTGVKERFLGIFPHPGVADEEIRGARKFGSILLDAFSRNELTDLQSRLNRAGAVTVVPAYILFEQRIAKVFNIWAQFIRRKGGPGNVARKPRLRVFIAYLFAAVFMLAPLATGVTWVLQKIKKKKVQALVSYFAENRIPPAG